MNQEYLTIEDAKKLANYDKIIAERDMYKSDNNLLKAALDGKDKHYMQVINEKNKYIKELESKVSSYESKQIDIFSEEVK